MKQACIILAMIAAFIISASAQDGNYTVKGEVSSISFSEGFVVVGSEDTYLYVFDEDLTFQRKWGSNDRVTATAASDEYIAFASMDSTLTVLDYRGEKNRYDVQLETYVEYDDALDTKKGVIAAGTRDGYLNVFEVKDALGLRWMEKTDAYILDVKILEDSIVAVSDKRILVYDLEGRLIRETELASYVRSVHVASDTIIVALGNNRLQFFGLDGNMRWEQELPEQIGTVYSSGDYVVVGLKDKSLYLYDSGGELVWRDKLSDSVVLAAVEERNVVAATLDDSLYLFDTDHRNIWLHETEGRVRDIKVSNTGIYVGTRDGVVYYFETVQEMRSAVIVLSVAAVVLLMGFLIFLKSLK